jgi:hypothetical protein
MKWELPKMDKVVGEKIRLLKPKSDRSMDDKNELGLE